jgi:hypothetical protein
MRDFHDLGNSAPFGNQSRDSFSPSTLIYIIANSSLANHHPSRATSVEAYVLEVDRLRVDAAFGARDPAGHFAGFENAVHYAVHECTII